MSIHSPTDGHLDYFQVWVIVNSAASWFILGLVLQGTCESLCDDQGVKICITGNWAVWGKDSMSTPFLDSRAWLPGRLYLCNWTLVNLLWLLNFWNLWRFGCELKQRKVIKGGKLKWIPNLKNTWKSGQETPKKLRGWKIKNKTDHAVGLSPILVMAF